MRQFLYFFTHRKFSLVRLFTEIFLPQGYPASVTQDYLTYQVWDTIQALCSSVTGVLSTRAILRGVGVGNEAATVSGAVLQVIIIFIYIFIYINYQLY